jgi:hypothetical protein
MAIFDERKSATRLRAIILRRRAEPERLPPLHPINKPEAGVLIVSDFNSPIKSQLLPCLSEYGAIICDLHVRSRDQLPGDTPIPLRAVRQPDFSEHNTSHTRRVQSLQISRRHKKCYRTIEILRAQATNKKLRPWS